MIRRIAPVLIASLAAACSSGSSTAEQPSSAEALTQGAPVSSADVSSPATNIAATQVVASPESSPRTIGRVIVHKDANCDCCGKWVDHVKAAGFKVAVNDTRDLQAVKRRLSVPDRLQSCHTAEIGGYVIEGHVPVDLIEKLLRERPQIAGLAVPGMPMGSPGMEGPYSEPYDVIAFDKNGATSVYATR